VELSRSRVWELWRRAETGPLCPEREFDLKRFYPAVKRLVKEYDITYDPETVIPTDNTLIDDAFKAAIDLLLEVGVLCTDTEKIIKLEEGEIKEALATFPKEITVGEGKDAVTLTHRKIEDDKPPRIMGGPNGSPISEEMAIPIYQSYIQEPMLDILFYGTPTTVEGMEVKAGSPVELYAEIANVYWMKEAARRAGRPGICTLGAAGATAAPQILASLVEGGYKKTDAMQLSPPPQLKAPYFMLCEAAHCIEYGCRGVVIPSSIIGGLAGGPEGAAITNIAECIAFAILFNTPWVHPFMPEALHAPGCSAYPPEMAMELLSIAALVKHANLIITSGANSRTFSGLCTDTTFYEIAAPAIGKTVIGANLHAGSARKGYYTDYMAGISARCTGEVGWAAVGLKREDANEMVKTIMAKYEDILPPKGTPPVGKKFQECYDVQTVTPTKEHEDLYKKVKKELENIGLAFKY